MSLLVKRKALVKAFKSQEFLVQRTFSQNEQNKYDLKPKYNLTPVQAIFYHLQKQVLVNLDRAENYLQWVLDNLEDHDHYDGEKVQNMNELKAALKSVCKFESMRIGKRSDFELGTLYVLLNKYIYFLPYPGEEENFRVEAINFIEAFFPEFIDISGLDFDTFEELTVNFDLNEEEEEELFRFSSYQDDFNDFEDDEDDDFEDDYFDDGYGSEGY